MRLTMQRGLRRHSQIAVATMVLGGLFACDCTDDGSRPRSDGGGSDAGSDAGRRFDGGDRDGGPIGPTGPVRRWDRNSASDSGRRPDLHVHADGTLDLAFFAGFSGASEVVHASSDGAGGWTTEVIEASDDDRPFHPPVEVVRDAGGAVHVAWATGDPPVLKHALREASGWRIETVATPGTAPALAVEADGTPHLAFLEPGSGSGVTVKHAVRVGASWTVVDVSPRDFFGPVNVGMALAGDDTPRIAYADRMTNLVQWARPEGGGWSVASIMGSDEPAGVVRMAFDGGGDAVVAFTGARSVRLARLSGGAWTVETTTDGYDDDWVDLALDTSGVVFLLADIEERYVEGLAVLERSGGGWARQAVGPRCRGGTPAIGVTPAGEPVVAFHCETVALHVMTVVGTYPDSWLTTCDAAADAFCNDACVCSAPDCCWRRPSIQTCTNDFGCRGNIRQDLCGDPTADPSLIEACLSEVGAAMCLPDVDPMDPMVLEFPPACVAIPNLRACCR